MNTSAMPFSPLASSSQRDVAFFFKKQPFAPAQHSLPATDSVRFSATQPVAVSALSLPEQKLIFLNLFQKLTDELEAGTLEISSDLQEHLPERRGFSVEPIPYRERGWGGAGFRIKFPTIRLLPLKYIIPLGAWKSPLFLNLASTSYFLKGENGRTVELTEYTTKQGKQVAGQWLTSPNADVSLFLEYKANGAPKSLRLLNSKDEVLTAIPVPSSLTHNKLMIKDGLADAMASLFKEVTQTVQAQRLQAATAQLLGEGEASPKPQHGSTFIHDDWMY